MLDLDIITAETEELLWGLDSTSFFHVSGGAGVVLGPEGPWMIIAVPFTTAFAAQTALERALRALNEAS